MYMKTGYRRGRIGDYSGGRPEEARIAWKSLHYEYEELGNENNLEQVARFLGIAPTSWPKVLGEFRRRYGDARGIWLTRTLEDSEMYEEYGDAEKMPYREEDVIVDIGPDGIYVLDRRYPIPSPRKQSTRKRTRRTPTTTITKMHLT